MTYCVDWMTIEITSLQLVSIGKKKDKYVECLWEPAAKKKFNIKVEMFYIGEICQCGL